MDLDTHEPLPQTQSGPPIGFMIGAAFISGLIWLSLLLGRVSSFIN